MADFGISSLIPHADMLKSDLEIGTTTGESVIIASIFFELLVFNQNVTLAIVLQIEHGKQAGLVSLYPQTNKVLQLQFTFNNLEVVRIPWAINDIKDPLERSLLVYQKFKKFQFLNYSHMHDIDCSILSHQFTLFKTVDEKLS